MPDAPQGSFSCKHTKCKCCSNISEGRKTFRSNTTGEAFTIKTHLSCSSNYVIYLLECSCNLQYISRTTQALRSRINNHRWNIKNGFIKHSVSRNALHFHNCDFFSSFFIFQFFYCILQSSHFCFCFTAPLDRNGYYHYFCAGHTFFPKHHIYTHYQYHRYVYPLLHINSISYANQFPISLLPPLILLLFSSIHLSIHIHSPFFPHYLSHHSYIHHF